MPKFLKNTNQLFIIRGLPGSGKTTLAKDMLERGLIHHYVEADQFMVDENNNYQFNPENLKFCHECCQAWVEHYLWQGYNVAVCNTFTRIWEMQPYFRMGYPYSVIEAKGNYKNVHGVPNHVVAAMKKRWQEYKEG